MRCFKGADLSDDVQLRQFIGHATAALLLIEMHPDEDQQKAVATLVSDLGDAIRRLDALEGDRAGPGARIMVAGIRSGRSCLNE